MAPSCFPELADYFRRRPVDCACPPMQLRVGRRGVDLSNLRPLDRAAPLDSDDHILHLALINARSLANKTFLLNDFSLHVSWILCF